MGWTGTPEEKRAYALKKRMERAGQNRQRSEAPPVGRRTPLPGYAVHPDNHRCTPWDITYTLGLDARCEVCGRRWGEMQDVGRGMKRRLVVPFTRRLPD